MSANRMPLCKHSAAAPTHPEYPSPQIIEDRYIDDQKLVAVCKEKFGSNYKLKFKFNRWFLQAPCWLDEYTLELCEIQYL